MSQKNLNWPHYLIKLQFCLHPAGPIYPPLAMIILPGGTTYRTDIWGNLLGHINWASGQFSKFLPRFVHFPNFVILARAGYIMQKQPLE